MSVTAFKDLLSTDAQPGRVAWIGLRPARHDEIVAVTDAEIAEDGLVGDHGKIGKRAVTLLQAEHLAVIGAYLGQPPVAPHLLRRNLVVSGLNLASLRHAELQLGTAFVEITGPCAPCSRMQAALGPGGYNAMRGHGGWYATIVRSGAVALGDSVTRR